MTASAANAAAVSAARMSKSLLASRNMSSMVIASDTAAKFLPWYRRSKRFQLSSVNGLAMAFTPASAYSGKLP